MIYSDCLSKYFYLIILIRNKLMRQIGDYLLLNEIGTGMFSSVYRCRNVKTNQIFACKMLRRESMNRKSWQNLHDEIKILENVNSPHIVKLFERFKTNRHFYLILEYCNGGDLESLLERRLILSEQEARSIYSQVLLAMQEMNKIKAIHRDIKNANILLNFPCN